MKTGTKSLLFGIHQFIFHPITVLMAWLYLYHALPNFKELICIIIHDWGYWGQVDMDGETGERHPELAAKLANKLFGPEYKDFCLFHSRHYARRFGHEPSKLCWADKLSIIYYPAWLYLCLGHASREISEYRMTAYKGASFDLTHSDYEWFLWVRDRLITLGLEKRADAVGYVNPNRRD